LKKMMVAAVDNGDANRGALQTLCGFEARKTTSKNHNMRFGHRRSLTPICVHISSYIFGKVKRYFEAKE